MLDSRESDLEFAKEILARLERYAARVRAGTIEPPAPASPPPKHPMATATAPRSDQLPSELPWLHLPQSDAHRLDDQLPTQAPPATHHRRTTTRRRIDPATVDLFPYDLAAAIVTCALTVFAFAALGTVAGVIVTVALVAAGICARQYRYFPSAGVKALIGVAVGLLLVLLS
jgi:hypothetical protein